MAKHTRPLLITLAVVVLLGGGVLVFKNLPQDFFFGLKQDIQLARVGPTLSESKPLLLRIPALNINAPIIELGLQDNKEIEIPEGYEEVGWYRHGPTPGELGPAVVVGHVDSYEGAAVFYSLGQLKPGDLIEIDREDGTTALFEVKILERYPQDDFPTEKVYGNIDHAGLRLITCSGSYDREAERYNRNLVVYASLVEPVAGESPEE